MSRLLLKYTHLILIPIILYASFFLFQHFTSPFTRHSDLNSLIYVFHAKNLLRYPSSLHHYANANIVTSNGISSMLNYLPHDRITYYLDHSPLITYLAAFSFSLFGINEWAARLVPIISSLITLIVFYLLVKKVSNLSTALLATFFLGSFPLFLQHGQILNFEPTTNLFITLSLYFFFSHLCPNSSRTNIIFGYIFFLLAQLTDWPGSFLGASLALLILTYKKSFSKALFPLLFSLIGPLMIFMWDQQAAPGFGPGFFRSVFGSYQHSLAVMISPGYTKPQS